jgi:membrane protease YdiL (CAAX protease family)
MHDLICLAISNCTGFLKWSDLWIVLVGCLTALMVFWVPEKAFVQNRAISSLMVIMYPLALFLSIRLASRGGVFYWWDGLALAVMYAGMLDLIVPIILIRQRNLIEFDLVYRLLFVGLFWYYLFFRKIAVNFSFQICWKGLWVTLGITLVLVLLNMGIGTRMKFFSLTSCTKDWKSIFIIVIYEIFFVSLAQEVFFRGFLYGYIRQYSPGYGIPIILSSVIFGLGHIRYAGWPMVAVATVAGFGYCLVYQSTGYNMNCAIMSHTVTNLIWWLFTKNREG